MWRESAGRWSRATLLYLGTGFASDVSAFSCAHAAEIRTRGSFGQDAGYDRAIESFRTVTCSDRLECGPVLLQLPYVSPDWPVAALPLL